MTAVFLQVRLDSSRLPRKALADLGGKPVVVRCFEALAAVAADLRVLVTEPGSAPELEPWAHSSGWRTFVGSKENVLDRFVQGARAFGVDTVIRATGDNPLVSARLANQLAGRHTERSSDYSGFLGGPVGSGVEVLRVEALERAWASDPDAYEREHVSPFLYRNPDRFAVDHPDVPPPCRAPEARITLDTPEDLAYLRALWSDLYQGVPPETEDLIPWLNRHPR
jgi:spore coat polysaccharide biosynthesis protein SpsF